MPNILKPLRDEITRLAKKEIKSGTTALCTLGGPTRYSRQNPSQREILCTWRASAPCRSIGPTQHLAPHHAARSGKGHHDKCIPPPQPRTEFLQSRLAPRAVYLSGILLFPHSQFLPAQETE